MFLKSIRYRIMFWYILCLFTSVLAVAATTYFLFAQSLRVKDQDFIMARSREYIHSYKTTGLSGLEKYILSQKKLIDEQEILVALGDSLLFLPGYLDGDDEDQEELEQIRRDVKVMNQVEGWRTILLHSGEDDSLLEKLEVKIVHLLISWDQMSLVPIFDRDLFEVHTVKLDDGQWLRVGKSAEEREDQLARIRDISLTVFGVFTSLGLLSSFFLASGILNPLRKVISTMKRIEAGESDAKVSLSGSGDEIDQLSERFNQIMLSNRNLISRLKETLDNVAHDLKTPLTRFRMSAEMALEKNDPTLMSEALSDSMENSQQMISLLSAIMDTSEAESGVMFLKLQKLSFKSVVEDVLDLYEFVAEEKSILLQGNLEEGFILGDETRLLQALGNLVDNAIKYSAENSKVILTLKAEERYLVLSIKDQGQGIDPGNISKIWDRLYREDESRSTPGLGIGLSVVKAIVMAHKGKVQVISDGKTGSEFFVTLPKCHDEDRLR